MVATPHKTKPVRRQLHPRSGAAQRPLVYVVLYEIAWQHGHTGTLEDPVPESQDAHGAAGEEGDDGEEKGTRNAPAIPESLFSPTEYNNGYLNPIPLFPE